MYRVMLVLYYRPHTLNECIGVLWLQQNVEKLKRGGYFCSNQIVPRLENYGRNVNVKGNIFSTLFKRHHDMLLSTLKKSVFKKMNLT